jgi:hypothetical protein
MKFPASRRVKPDFPHCALTCSECAGTLDRKGSAVDLGGMSPFLYAAAATFENSDAAREFAKKHGWLSDAGRNIDLCPLCASLAPRPLTSTPHGIGSTGGAVTGGSTGGAIQ